MFLILFCSPISKSIIEEKFNYNKKNRILGKQNHKYIDGILLIASVKSNFCKWGQYAKFISIVNNGNNDKLVEFCVAYFVSRKLLRLIKAVGCMTDVSQGFST